LDVTGDNLQRASAFVKTLSKVYEKDYNEVLTAANAVSKEFGITGSQALILIDEGFQRGADASGEFLDILKEYPAQLASVGLGADESIAIITQQVNQGVFSDKGIDAIKEAGIRLRELTPEAAKALDAIGLSSVEIQKSIQDGSKSTFEVIQEISARFDELGQNAPGVQAAIAGIFGGAGEDAGFRYLTTLKDVNTELGEIEKNTTPAEDATRELTEQWDRFITVVSESLEDSKIVNFITGVKNRIADLLATTTGSIDELEALINEAEDLFESFGGANRKENIDNIIKDFGRIDVMLAKSTDYLQTFKAEQERLQLQFDEDGLLSTEQALNRATEQVQFYEEQIASIGDHKKKIVDSFKILNDAGEQFVGITDDQIKVLETYGVTLDLASNTTTQNTRTTNTNTDAVEENTDAVEENTDAVNRRAEVLDLIYRREDELTGIQKQRLKVVESLTRQSKEAFQDAISTSGFQSIEDSFAETRSKVGAELAQIESDYLTAIENIERESATLGETISGGPIGQLGDFLNENLSVASAAVDGYLTVSEAYIEGINAEAESEIELTRQRISATESVIQEKEKALKKEQELAAKGVANNSSALQKELEAERQKLAEEEALGRRQFEEKKRREKAQVRINLGLELAQIALSAAQNPLNGVTAGVAGIIQYAAQAAAAIIRSRNNVQQIEAAQFAVGTEYVQGPGTGTSDSIPANVSKGERIVTASQNAQITAALGYMPANKDLPELLQAGANALFVNGGNTDMSETNAILGGIERNTRASERGTNSTGQQWARFGKKTVVNP